MSGTAIGLLGIAALFVLLVLRIPVAFAMFVVGFFGFEQILAIAWRNPGVVD